MHPDIEILVLFRDGELESDTAATLSCHISKCDACRLELQRLQRVLAEADRLSAVKAEPETFDRVLTTIRHWEADTSAVESLTSTIRGRVAECVAAFFGNAAARAILDPVPEDGRNLLSTAEYTLGEFLGHKAAAALINQALDTPIVRI